MSQSPDFVLGDEFARILTETTMSLVCVLGEDGRILFFNDACERLTGFTRDEVVGRDAREFVIPPEEAEAFGEVLAYVWKTGLSSPQVGHWVTKDGERKLIAWSNKLMVGEDASPTILVTTGIDLGARDPRVHDEGAFEGDPEAKLAEIGRLAQEQRALRRVATLVASEASPETRLHRRVRGMCTRPRGRSLRGLPLRRRRHRNGRRSLHTGGDRSISASACESLRPRPAASARCSAPARRRESATTPTARETSPR